MDYKGKRPDLVGNIISRYEVTLFSVNRREPLWIFYDMLYYRAYLKVDEAMETNIYITTPSVARYIDSLLENYGIITVMDSSSLSLFLAVRPNTGL